MFSTLYFILCMALVLWSSTAYAESGILKSILKQRPLSTFIQKVTAPCKIMFKNQHVKALYSTSSDSIIATEESVKANKWAKTVKLSVNLFLWYAVSAMYNIYNKKALTALKMPWTVALIQLGGGLLFFFPLWLLRIRPCPFDTVQELGELMWAMKNVALFATIAHCAGVTALGLGTVSFTQVVKAGEPIFTAALGAVFLKDYLPIKSYLSLIPVMVGVSLASVSELSFSWPCLIAGLISNAFSGARSVFSKLQMCGEVKCTEELSPENFYSVLTIVSFLLLIPLTILVEFSPLSSMAGKIASQSLSSVHAIGLQQAMISSLLFYVYNEMSFKVLSEVSPVSHALANTMKRVVIILSSVFIFRNSLNTMGKVGSALAIFGAFLYSLTRK